MPSKRQNMFYEIKKQETTEIGTAIDSVETVVQSHFLHVLEDFRMLRSTRSVGGHIGVKHALYLRLSGVPSARGAQGVLVWSYLRALLILELEGAATGETPAHHSHTLDDRPPLQASGDDPS
ncbi:hypothetical protein AAG570_004126 [Ranatra chinensis]|uniref:Uncharacterized protein n=1 Tax=Ranatra chinensis TaxID=642074 RepID=A0ABD0Y2W7_9HEMI